MRRSIRVFLLAVSCLTGAGTAFAAGEKEAKTARTKTGTVIKCAPEANAEVKSATEAAGLLKKGMVLQISPGTYTNDVLAINTDGVIIEGEPGKFCSIRLSIHSKGCVVRNIWLPSLSHVNDLTVVDSIINYYEIDTSSKADVLLDNCCFRNINVNYYNKKLLFNNCTICSFEDGMDLYGGAITVNKSIVYSLDTAFKIGSWDRVKLTIGESLIFGKSSLGADTSQKNVALDVKGFKNICNFTKKGNILTAKPLFESDIAEELAADGTRACGTTTTVIRRAGSCGIASISSYSSEDNLKNFILKPDSPGKKEDYGAFLSEAGFPIPRDAK